MAILNYPERILKTTLPAIDVVMGNSKNKVYQYSQDITASAIDNSLSADRNWKVNSILLNFSNATARNFSVSISGGRKVVENYNDFLWIQCDTTVWQKIVLDPGFYTGSQLATHLQNKLDANDAFDAQGLTFSVTYDNATGLFVITPSAGTIRYLNRNLSQVLGLRDSIAGNLFGLSEDTSFGSDITSDTPCAGLDSDSHFIDQTANGDTFYAYTYPPLSLSIDQAIRIQTNTAAVVVSANINYDIL